MGTPPCSTYYTQIVGKNQPILRRVFNVNSVVRVAGAAQKKPRTSKEILNVRIYLQLPIML